MLLLFLVYCTCPAHATTGPLLADNAFGTVLQYMNKQSMKRISLKKASLDVMPPTVQNTFWLIPDLTSCCTAWSD